MHDFNPGILPNGLFWTMSIPNDAFRVRRGGREARLRVRDIPVPDTFTFANNVSVAAQISADVRWRATSRRVRRGFGNTVPENDFGAFEGHFAEARCTGRASGAETGFSFKTDMLTEDGFFAELGPERNGSFL